MGNLSAEALVAARRIHESFLAGLKVDLTALLQSPVSATPQDFRQGQLSDVCEVAGSGYPMTLRLETMGGCAGVVYSDALLFRMLDIFLDAPSSPSDDGSRIVTSIEFIILQTFFDVVIDNLRRSWGDACRAALGPVSDSEEAARDSISEFSQQSVLMATSVIDVNGSRGGFEVAIPSFVVRLAHLRMKKAGQEIQRAEPDQIIPAALGRATVVMEGVLRGAEIRVRDLMGLEPGKILLVGSPIDADFECLVNGSLQFKGELVGSGNRCAFHVTKLENEVSSAHPGISA